MIRPHLSLSILSLHLHIIHKFYVSSLSISIHEASTYLHQENPIGMKALLHQVVFRAKVLQELSVPSSFRLKFLCWFLISCCSSLLYCLAVFFLIFKLIWCVVWKFQSVHLVQLFLSTLCAILCRIPCNFCVFCLDLLFVPAGWPEHLCASLRAALQEPFAPAPTFSFLHRKHLKQRDKWRPHGRLHSDAQVSYWAENTETLLVAEHRKVNVQSSV